MPFEYVELHEFRNIFEDGNLTEGVSLWRLRGAEADIEKVEKYKTEAKLPRNWNSGNSEKSNNNQRFTLRRRKVDGGESVILTMNQRIHRYKIDRIHLSILIRSMNMITMDPKTENELIINDIRKLVNHEII